MIWGPTESYKPQEAEMITIKEYDRQFGSWTLLR